METRRNLYLFPAYRQGWTETMRSETPTYRPLVTACADHGISRTVAFDLARSGLLDTFTIGTRRYVRLDSLRTLPERLAANDGGEA